MKASSISKHDPATDAALSWSVCRPAAAGDDPHRRAAGRLRLRRGRAPRPPIPMRHLHCVEHVHESDRLAERHIRVPVMSRIGKTHGFAVLHNVGQDHDLGMSRLLKQRGDVHFQSAKSAAERHLLRRAQTLAGKTDHTVVRQGAQCKTELVATERLNQIDAFDSATQGFTRCRQLPHTHLSSAYCPVAESCAGDAAPTTARAR